MKEVWSGQDQTSRLCRHYLSFRAVTSQVFSARVSLTAVFGMGTGGPSPRSAPTSPPAAAGYIINGSLRHDLHLFTCLLLERHHSRRSGTPSGTRTLDTLIKSQVLYQLS